MRLIRTFFLGIVMSALFFSSFSGAVNAEVFSSNSFRILDPVIDTTSGFSSSTSFKLQQSIGQLSPGTSTASSFGLRSGFLFFPTVTIPTVTATAGDGQVSFSWTSSTGFLGWIVSGYNIGYSTVSGGPYTFTDAGNVTSYSVTGLTNGTTYYFIVRPEDAFGNSIATSSEVLATPVASPQTPTGGGGGPIGLIINIARPPSIVLEVISPDEKRKQCAETADFNKSGKVDLQDLSILLYHLTASENNFDPFDLNKDKKLDIVDISILFYCWGV